MSHFLNRLTHYHIGDRIHESDRTLVYHGQRKETGQPVVIKLMGHEYPSFNELVQFRNQYAIAKQLNIPGIVKPYSLERYDNRYALIMEDFGGIALSDTMRDNSQYSLTEIPQFLNIAIQLADTLHHLHQSRIIHKDIKPANILIHPETKQVKLIDFSISTLLPKETQTLQTPKVLEGTLAYISPEQTGRMNRGIDYRSDFYSLGVTFYEMLYGELPFCSDDPLELIHAHIAKTPKAKASGKIPEGLTPIVMKLMAKNAEDRYQNALGLKYDLEQCLQQWQNTGKIEPFELGKRDICDRFLIPETLYGRETEVQRLLNAFNQVSAGKHELLLVAGYSGVGKTAVVNEVHKPIVEKRGYFIKGKFDQFQRNIPLSAFVQAFQNLIEQILGESDKQLQQWKTKILEVLKENAQVILDMIPELDQIIGQQPPVPELSGNAAQSRFNLLFQKFVSIFATAEHPLVIFLDDLQWSDLGSLNLIKLLISEIQTPYLLIIGAYRDNEVFPAHPLMITLDAIKKQEINFQQIILKPLEKQSINQWFSDTLKCDSQRAQPLTDLLFQKTKGNPFFTTQFLKSLYEDGLITFDSQAGYWQCNLSQLRDLMLTDDVVQFMTSRLQKLHSSTQKVLKLAACIGNQFDLETLAVVSEQTPQETAENLWEALAEGLLVPQSQIYKFYQGNLDINFNIENSQFFYKFLHDRVQQAAYSLIPEPERPEIHLKMGQLLLNNPVIAYHEDNLFDIVNHLNIGSDLIVETEERLNLAKLNLKASQKAKNSIAYALAVELSQQGINLLPENSWKSQYSLTLYLHEMSAEVLFLQGNFEKMKSCIDTIKKETPNLLESIKAYEVEIQALIARARMKEAVVLGLTVLKMLAIDLEKSGTEEATQQELQNLQNRLAALSMAELMALPKMTNPEKLAAMRMLLSIAAAAYIFAPNMYLPLVFQLVNLSIDFGNTEASIYGYAAYGLVLCGLVGNPELGYQFGQLAIQLLQQFQARELTAKTFLIIGAFTNHWSHPLEDTLPVLLEGYTVGQEVGDPEFGAYCAYIYSCYFYFAGKPLPLVEKELATYSEAIAQLKQEATLNWQIAIWQGVEQLLGENAKLRKNALYQQRVKLLAEEEEISDERLVFYTLVSQIIANYLLENHEEAAKKAEMARHYTNGAIGLYFFGVFFFYDTLIQLANPDPQTDLWPDIETNINQLEKWAIHAPMNYQHKWELVKAEQYRVQGERLQAMDAYDRAIAEAKKHQYLQEEALANELAAKFYLTDGKENIAALYLQQAYYSYARWGAKAKTDHLEKHYPQLLTPIFNQQPLTIDPANTLVSWTQGTISSTTTHSGQMFDLASFMKASRTLSEEIDLDRAITNLMQVVLENAGADTVVLMLIEENTLMVKAKITQGVLVDVTPTPVPEYPHLPQSMINTVKRTRKPLIFDSAKPNANYVNDPYLRQNQPQSVLSVPLLVRSEKDAQKTQLVGLLYLENNQCAGVFTRDRADILNLLCSQAAIALNNSRLYGEIKHYAQQLQQTQLQLVQNEKMATLGNLVAGVAHEINNPLGFISGNITVAGDYLQDLLTLLDLYSEKYPHPDPEISETLEDLDIEFVTEDFAKVIASMRKGVDRIRNISNSLRTFSRADTDHKTAFNIHDGINSTLLILKYRFKANDKRPAIVIHTHYGDIPEIQCYPGQLNQVFMNLLANAIDALEESSQDQTFTEIEAQPNEIIITTQWDEPQNQVSISIKDNGIGMPDPVKNRIFEQGFTTKAVGKGTGLGMAIAHQIVVEKHQGKITCQSELGKGTEFLITLPRNFVG